MSLSDSDKDVVIPWVNLASELEIWDGMGCGVKLRDSARGGGYTKKLKSALLSHRTKYSIDRAFDSSNYLLGAGPYSEKRFIGSSTLSVITAC